MFVLPIEQLSVTDLALCRYVTAGGPAPTADRRVARAAHRSRRTISSCLQCPKCRSTCRGVRRSLRFRRGPRKCLLSAALHSARSFARAPHWNLFNSFLNLVLFTDPRYCAISVHVVCQSTPFCSSVELSRLQIKAYEHIKEYREYFCKTAKNDV